MNESLNELYQVWLKNVIESNKTNKNRSSFTKPIPLYNGDEKCQIMIIAQESHEEAYPVENYTEKRVCSIIDESKEAVKCHRDKCKSGECKSDRVYQFANRINEKAKMDINIDNILCNNMNKISINGSHTAANKIKEQFAKVGKDKIYKSILDAEVKILQPKYLILACGPSYKQHIIEAFDVDFNKLTERKTVSRKESVWLDITKIFKLKENYKSLEKVIWCFHPRALYNVDKKGIIDSLN